MAGTLTPLYWPDARGGLGQLVDVALSEACFTMLEAAVPEYVNAGSDREPRGSTIGDNVPSNLFRTRDDRWVVIAANVDTVFRKLARYSVPLTWPTICASATITVAVPTRTRSKRSSPRGQPSGTLRRSIG